MLNEYIKELIASNNRVIIPNFGAFLLRATSKNKNKKDLASKIEDIYFSPFLKFNDELLVNHIMKKEEVDQKAALEKVNEYIKTIEDSVNKEGSFKIQGLGEFYQDAQGKIQFKINPSGATAEDKAPQKKAEKEPKKAQPKTEDKSTEDKSTKKTVNEKAASSKTEGAKVKPEAAKPVSSKPTNEKGKAQSTQSKTKTPSSGAGKPPKTAKPSGNKKTNKGLVLSIAIGVPVAAIFIWAMLNLDTVSTIFGGKEEKKENTVAENVDKKEEATDKSTQEKEASTDKTKKSGESKEKQETAQKQNDQSAKQEKASPKTKKYYIVAGSFRKKQNAINFRNKLQKEGYKSELIGERNGMHAVSYSSFQSKAKAQAELSMFRRKGIQAWLLYH